jgi:hypothetical protein
MNAWLRVEWRRGGGSARAVSHLHAPVVAEVIDLEAVFDHLDGEKLRSACGADA